MQPVEIERKLRQLDNDVQSIYEMLAGIQATQTRQGNRLEEMAGALDRLEERMIGLEARFDRLEGKLDRILAALEEEVE
jgi:hypothetical protein